MSREEQIIEVLDSKNTNQVNPICRIQESMKAIKNDPGLGRLGCSVG